MAHIHPPVWSASMRTLLGKMVGVTFGVAGGLAMGKEGPMVHIGSVVGAGVSQGRSWSLPFLSTGLFKAFRNDAEKRECVAFLANRRRARVLRTHPRAGRAALCRRARRRAWRRPSARRLAACCCAWRRARRSGPSR